MRRRGRSSAGRWALGALLVVALVGGVAWAETQVVATPPGPDVTVVAVLVPGAGGGEVCGDKKGDEHVNFNSGGDIEVNGEVCAGNDPEATYSVTIHYLQAMGMWFVEIMVHNDSAGPMVYMGGHPAGEVPGSFSATGEQVILLTAQ